MIQRHLELKCPPVFSVKSLFKIPPPNWKEGGADSPASGNANPCLAILLIHRCQRRLSPEGHRSTSKERISSFALGAEQIVLNGSISQGFPRMGIHRLPLR